MISARSLILLLVIVGMVVPVMASETTIVLNTTLILRMLRGEPVTMMQIGMVVIGIVVVIAIFGVMIILGGSIEAL